PMLDFEAKISAKYVRANCEPSDRKPESYALNNLTFCSIWTGILERSISLLREYRWNLLGPFINRRRTHLQRELGDDNVLIVQFTDHLDSNMPFDQQSWIAARQTISDRISIGVCHYSLFGARSSVNCTINTLSSPSSLC
nr:RNA-dependent RNA polymerase, eukaryotic-type [Tanacetum cinerariifolium]